MCCSLNHEAVRAAPSADPEGGGGGGRGSGPPLENHNFKWVSIGNKQLDTPRKKLDTPGKNWTPSGALKNDRFL